MVSTRARYIMEQAESDQNPLFTDPMGQPSSAVLYPGPLDVLRQQDGDAA